MLPRATLPLIFNKYNKFLNPTKSLNLDVGIQKVFKFPYYHLAEITIKTFS